MALPEVTGEVLDGALGLAPENIDGLHVKLGVSSLGTPATLYSFSRPSDVIATLGYGPLPEALCHHLQIAGGPVLAMPITAGTAGTSTVPVNSGGGPAVTLTGAPVDRFDGIVKITLGGAVGTATFQYSLDGGDTWSQVITTAATYLMPNSGVTLNFAAGTYVLAATYTWTSTAPYYSTTNLNTAFTALLADPREWGFAHVVGHGTAADDTAAMAAAVETHMQAAAVNYRFVQALIEASDDTDSNLITAFAAVAAPLVAVAAGFVEALSAVTGRIYKRHAAWNVAARASKVALRARVGIATNLLRVRADSHGGSLPGISRLLRDEYATPGLDAARFTTLRTIIGKQGFYITRGRMMAANGSDYSFWHDRRVINKGCRLVRGALLDELGEDVRLNANGTILEADALRIEGTITRALESNMVNIRNCTAASATVDRVQNIASTGRILVDVRIRRLGYLEDIRWTLGFEAPHTAQAA